ncbi:MAG: hypothetical protein IT502_08330 [Rubrivivax sp.]|nr:hypothetical protein [Rubrivivax sp.]
MLGAIGAGPFGLSGCATRAPTPPGAAPAPGAARPSAPQAARSWDEFRHNAGLRLVAAQPARAYTGAVPDVLFGIPIIETELNADGTIRGIVVLRRPSNPAAADTVQLAVDAIRRAAPYGDMTRLPRPWKWVETFLFNDARQFKPRSLD